MSRAAAQRQPEVSLCPAQQQNDDDDHEQGTEAYVHAPVPTQYRPAPTIGRRTYAGVTRNMGPRMGGSTAQPPGLVTIVNR